MSDSPLDVTPHPGEAHTTGHSSMLNWLRAGVLGANDGIVSVAGLVMGVAGATTNRTPIVIAGVAGIVSGALSMAAGEYVSVSTQRDSELALLDKERRELVEMPDEELDELTQIYADKGLDARLAREVAVQLTAHDALRAHADVELNLDPDDLTSPWAAAAASFVSFALGALIPLLAVLLPSPSWRVPVTVAAVIVALALAGLISARVGGQHPGEPSRAMWVAASWRWASPSRWAHSWEPTCEPTRYATRGRRSFGSDDAPVNVSSACVPW